ncbi:alpha-mannosidase [Pedobacter yonginense]|uniref:Alpha-mannosidase n=1 Tax=Pedobacter yonginense TaxID=651869 RepID=A0A317EHM2_9SPHI|nr:GH92 family glycosyl hydrolase [Pedobacter yonginense]PWS26311.1 alpha-mannosidase [Pedobacter yonginense]
MIRKFPLFFLVLFSFQSVNAQKLTDLVDPFIGTGGHGHTYPGAAVPFGMVQLSPDNGRSGWDWSSGYHYSDSTITGFSHTHLSGTGIGDWCDISVMPFVNSDTDKKATFSHKNEKAAPGYYSVKMSSGILASFTVTERVGFHSYAFPEGAKPMIQFDLGFHINWDKTEQGYVSVLNDSTLIGYRYSTGWAKNQKVYFAARTSKAFSLYKLYAAGGVVAGNKLLDTAARVQLFFPDAAGKKVLLKVALSSTTAEKALLALNEVKHWDFEKTRKDASAKWEAELQKIKIQSSDQALKKIFYTALYHTCLSPVLYSDADGAYQNAKSAQLKMEKGAQRYTVYSLWDTFRALNPLFTLTQPKKYPDILKSMMAFYRENGLLPVWDLSTWEANTMTGYHAVPVLADAVLKGVPGLDIKEAYQAMRASATQTSRNVPDYMKYGYLPQDKGGWSVTVTLEYAFDDYCIAQVAKKLGLMDDYKLFMGRAVAYQRLFDPVTGFIRARNSDGKFTVPFDPYFSEHEEKAEYIEGNAWQHSFFVPQDPRGLANEHGGYGQFVKKLDSLFSVSSVVKGQNASADVSGLIGQYAHGNEPSHHIAYLYSYVGSAWKTQEKVRMIADSMYHAKPDGYAGNEDCGQMSAWFVWNAIGFYPANPVSGQYVFGSPLVDRADLQLPNGKSLHVEVNNNSKTNKYIQKVWLNGKVLSADFISHNQILSGGKLVFLMGSKPNRNWASKPKDWPSSIN